MESSRYALPLSAATSADVALADEVRAGQKRLAEMQKALAEAKAAALEATAVQLPNGAKHLVAQVDGVDGKALQVRAQLPSRSEEYQMIPEPRVRNWEESRGRSACPQATPSCCALVARGISWGRWIG